MVVTLEIKGMVHLLENSGPKSMDSDAALLGLSGL